MSDTIKQEQENVRKLLDFLSEHDWEVVEVDEDDVEDTEEAMELLSDLEAAWVRVNKGGDRYHSFFVVFGNSPAEVIADWTFARDDEDGFNALMEEFTRSIDNE